MPMYPLMPHAYPVDLQSLIPLAAKYGHGKRVLLEDCAAKMSGSDAAQIVSEISAKLPAIERWVDSFPPTSFAKEVVAFRSLLELRTPLRPIIVAPGKAIL